MDSFRVVFRSIVIRQFESLQAISQMVHMRIRFSAGPLLRPACEELDWAKYLLKLPSDEAEQLVSYVALDGQFRSLRAQDKYAGRSVTESLGLFPHYESSKRIRTEILGKLRKLGTRHGWPESVIEGGQLPSVSWLAKATDEQLLYEFLYRCNLTLCSL